MAGAAVPAAHHVAPLVRGVEPDAGTYPVAVIHVVGAAGTVLVLGAYFLVSTGRLRSESTGFQGMNLVGALLLTGYALALSAWATVALNAVWAVIALVALRRVLARRA